MTDRLLAVDPGYTHSAWVLMNGARPIAFAKESNAQVETRILTMVVDRFAVESVAGYGMPVGREVFETCVWTGRFIAAWNDNQHAAWIDDAAAEAIRVYRRDVKLHLCGRSGANDANIRAALIELYGPGKELAIGKKATPGPLYGVKADIWAALGVARTVVDGAPLSFEAVAS